MLTLNLSKSAEIPLYKQIYEYYANEIRNGILKEKTKLPSVRELTKKLGVSKNTVESAYQQLCAEGYVVSVPKSGFVVTKVQEVFYHAEKTLQQKIKETNLKTNEDLKSNVIDVSSSQVDESIFPSSVLKTLYREAVSGNNSKKFLCRGNSLGEEDFRKTLANHLYESRGVKCSYEQIIIGAGTEYLLSLAVKIIEKYVSTTKKNNENKKLIFAVENPGYEKTESIISDNGAIVKKINLDKDGISVKEINETEIDCVYCTPSHEYPMGITMPISRRSELLSWAYELSNYDIKYDTKNMTNCRFIIEDDYDSDYRYQGNSIPALQGFDTKDCVLYIGTFSRSLSPSMRVGYLVLPKRLMKVFCQDLSYYSNTVSRIEQFVLNKFIYDKHFERHINRTRKLYEQRRNVLIKELKLTIPDIKIFGEEAGLHFIAKIDDIKYDNLYMTIIKKASDKNLLIGGTESFLIFCYAHIDETKAKEIAQILCQVLQEIKL